MLKHMQLQGQQDLKTTVWQETLVRYSLPVVSQVYIQQETHVIPIVCNKH